MDTSALIETLTKLSPPVALVAVCNVIGLVLSKIKKLDNEWIPFVLILFAGTAYPMIADSANMPWDIPYPVAYKVLIGFLIGGASVGINQAKRMLFPPKEDPAPPTPPSPPPGA